MKLNTLALAVLSLASHAKGQIVQFSNTPPLLLQERIAQNTHRSLQSECEELIGLLAVPTSRPEWEHRAEKVARLTFLLKQPSIKISDINLNNLFFVRDITPNMFGLGLDKTPPSIQIKFSPHALQNIDKITIDKLIIAIQKQRLKFDRDDASYTLLQEIKAGQASIKTDILDLRKSLGLTPKNYQEDFDLEGFKDFKAPIINYAKLLTFGHLITPLSDYSVSAILRLDRFTDSGTPLYKAFENLRADDYNGANRTKGHALPAITALNILNNHAPEIITNYNRYYQRLNVLADLLRQPNEIIPKRKSENLELALN